MRRFLDFFKWFWQVVRQLWFVLAFIIGIADLIYYAIPTKNIHPSIGALLNDGGNWKITIPILVVGFLLSAYRVYSRNSQEITRLNEKLNSIKSAKPDIVFGFKNSAGEFSTDILIRKKDIEKPPYEKIINELRDNIINNKDDRKSTMLSKNLDITIIHPINESSVEKYLKEYRQYLESLYLYEKLHCTYWIMDFAIKNIGNSPASKTTIEISLPKTYKKFTDDELFDVIDALEEDMPVPPDISMLYESSWRKSFANAFNTSSILPTNMSPFSNDKGPYLETRDNKQYIIYEVEKLIQHQLDIELDPFPYFIGNIDESIIELPVRITAEELSSPIQSNLKLFLQP